MRRGLLGHLELVEAGVVAEFTGRGGESGEDADGGCAARNKDYTTVWKKDATTISIAS